MLLYMLLSVAIVLGIGLVVRHFANNGNEYNIPITNMEFVWTSMLVAMLVVPTVTTISWKVSKNAQMTYVEQLNGWETGCNLSRTKCTRDGPCRWSYQCDPYLVTVSYSCGDSKNPRTCYRTETRYHDCPYAREEWHYTVSTTLGDFTIASNRLPTDYATNPWRRGEVAPRHVVVSAGVGNPEFWEQARDRIRSGNAGPVTKLHTYENYVLASQMTVLKTAVEQDIADYLALNLLPKIKKDIYSFYLVDKVYTVGTPAPPGFRDAAHRLASSMGYLRQGDLRVVLVNNPKIHANPDHYVNTLKAFWQSRVFQSTDALPKNAVVVVMGTDGQTIQWSRAFTGMPVGNEGLIAAYTTRLSGLPYRTDSLIGFLRHRSGANVGLDTLGRMSYLALQSELAYKRENMNVYSYLKGDIQPTQAAKVWSVVLSVLFGGLAWLIPLALHCPTDEKAKNSRNRYRSYYVPSSWR